MWRELLRSRWTWVVAGAGTAFVAGWILLSRGLFVHPQGDDVGSADAVVVLSGAEERLPVAERLMDEGVAPVLVVSNGAVDERVRCDQTVPYEIVCIRPESSRIGTRGEARAVARLADERGWRRIVVVTSDYHLLRAGLLLRRCVDGDVAMVPAASPRPWAAVLDEQGKLLGSLVVARAC
ncbi:MAG: YdcF family protein [Acidimicrobiales bacterium]|nr:YdcF family protein [Acidimicrobiales bacterium]